MTAVSALVQVTNDPCLHGRPCVAISFLAERFQSHIEITLGQRSANAKSLVELLMSIGEQAVTGAQVEVNALGPDAQDAVDAIVRLISTKCGEGLSHADLRELFAPTATDGPRHDDTREHDEETQRIDLRELLVPAATIVPLHADTLEEVVRQLTERLSALHGFSNPNALVEDVLGREREFSTGIGRGIAIPHMQSEHCTRLCVAAARLKHPVDWASINQEPVSVVFLTLAPSDAKGDKISVLMSIAALCQNENVPVQLAKAANTDAFLGIVRAS